MVDNAINKTIAKAINGDKAALNEVIKSIDKLVYNLSIKMLWSIDDAKDASQEILIKIITHLGSFKGESSFSTWVYRIATNYLLTYLSQKNHNQTLSFEILSETLAQGVLNEKEFNGNLGEQNLLVQEIKVGCTYGMLQCLNKDYRITYILGDILNFNSTEGSGIQNISEEAFRKRLSRARKQLFAFMQANCGIVQPKNNCRCKKQIDHCISTNKINRNKLLFATSGEDFDLLKKINLAEDAVKLFHTNPAYEMPEYEIKELKRILEIH
jgi:RNA polymerase sigma factor (sigma-70 family)